MIKKGKVSAIIGDKITVILPENDGIVTPPLEVYGGNKKPEEYKINEFVLVVFFNDDYNDGIILGKRYEFATDTPHHDENAVCAMFQKECIKPKENCANCTVQ